MAVFSKPLATGLAVLSAFQRVTGSPLDNRITKIKQLLGRTDFEWTAFGDSYPSGVGAGDYVSNSYRCLRYAQAYPQLIDVDRRLPGVHDFHNAVCSGSSNDDIQAYHFYDKDEFGKPNLQFSDRPRFGTPSMATLSIGGNDIDFPGIIFNCILEIDFTIPGQTRRSCDAQREYTWGLLSDPNVPDKISSLIKKIVDRARQGSIGDKFRLYVTGFPRFFSDQTRDCDQVTFARTANPNPDGKDHTKMTLELRKEFNAMSIQLNKRIADAVSENAAQGVTWVPIDQILDTHRFCEPGVAEPDQQNPNLWLFHYPYNTECKIALPG